MLQKLSSVDGSSRRHHHYYQPSTNLLQVVGMRVPVPDGAGSVRKKPLQVLSSYIVYLSPSPSMHPRGFI